MRRKSGVILYPTSEQHTPLTRRSIDAVSNHSDRSIQDYEANYIRKYSERVNACESPVGHGYLLRMSDVPVLYSQEKKTSYVHNRTLQVFVSTLLGIGFGLFLSHINLSSDLILLLHLPGQIFLRLINCIAIPLIFSSLASSVAEIIRLGQLTKLGMRSLLLFIIFSICSAVISIMIAIIMSRYYPLLNTPPSSVKRLSFHFSCQDRTSFFQVDSNGSLHCTKLNMTDATTFEMVDIQEETIKNSILDQTNKYLDVFFPSNIFVSFQQGIFPSITIFAVLFGAAASKVNTQVSSPLLHLFDQLNRMLQDMISRLVKLAPIAVFSLLASALSEQRSLGIAFNHVGTLLLGLLISTLILDVFMYPSLLWFMTKRFPFPYMKGMIPCLTLAFGSASSMATFPLLVLCVDKTREVPKALLRFIISIGVPIHMNGTAMVFPHCMVFLVATSNTEIVIGWYEILLIVFLSVLGSISAPPIPNGGMLFIYTIWSIVFVKHEIPISISLILALYWLIDRIETSCNVMGNAYVCRFLAEYVDETFDNMIAS